MDIIDSLRSEFDLINNKLDFIAVAIAEGSPGIGWIDNREFIIQDIAAPLGIPIYWEAGGDAGVYEDYLTAVPKKWNDEENHG